MKIDRTSLVAQMVKNLPAMQETRFDPWVGKIPWRREWLPTQYSFLENPLRTLVVYSLQGRKVSDTTEQLTHTVNILSVTVFNLIISTWFFDFIFHFGTRFPILSLINKFSLNLFAYL